MARAIINSDRQRPFGPSNGGIGTEFGDTWDIAVAKINAMFDEIYTVGTAVLNYTPPLQLSGTTVSLAPGGITNGFLANPSLTLGTTSLQLGGTYSTINGNLTFGGTVNFTGSVEIGGTPLSLPLTVPQGGTGQTSFTGNALLYGNGTSGFGQVPVNGTTTNKFLTQANGFPPSWNAIQNSDLPPPTTTALGGIKAVNAVSHQWLSSIDTTGTPLLSQPGFGDLSGNITVGQMNSGSGASSSTFWRGDGTWAATAGGVTSVSNVDGSLTILPTTGAVVGSLNTAHSNTWSVAQTFNAALTAYSLNGIGYVAPGVNGVNGTGAVDDAPAIQAILNAYDNVLIAPGYYLLGSTLTINVANPTRWIQGSGDQFFTVPPHGTFFLAKSTFSGSQAILVNGTAGNACSFRIGGFTLMNQTAGSGPSYGIHIANVGGNTYNEFDHVVVSGFAWDWLQSTSRSIAYNRCAGWNLDFSSNPTTGEFCWYLFAGANGFSGDAIFFQCLTRNGNATGQGIALTDQGASGVTIAGVKIIACNLYNANICLGMDVSGAGSSVQDVWATGGTQMNGTVSTQFAQMTTGNSSAFIQDIHFEGTYFVAANQGAIWGDCTAGGTIDAVFINNCFFDGFGNKAIAVSGAGCQDWKITNNTFTGISNSGAQAVLINGGSAHTFIGNNLTGSNSLSYFCSIGSGCSYVTAALNQANGVVSSANCIENLSSAGTIQLSLNQ